MKYLLLSCSPPLLQHYPSKPLLTHFRHRRCYAAPPNGNSGDISTAASEPSTNAQPSQPSTSPSNSKPTSIKDRVRSRNQARRVQEDYLPPFEVNIKPKSKAKDSAAAAPRKEKQRAPKKWEEMSLPEKALELYVGEKGVLFWLNKFAYASIFIMAGTWIVFRFVGPSLGLYQLDAPPLAPTDVLRGS